MASFDPKSFSRNEWGILGGVLVAFIGLFFDAWHVSAKSVRAGGLTFGGGSYSWTGWHFAGLWVPVLILAVPAALIVVVRALRRDLIPGNLPIGTRLVVLAALAVAVLIEMIRGLTYDSAPSGSGIDAGASFGTYLVCIATAVAAAFAAIDFKESGESLPTLPARSGPATPTEPSDPAV